MNSANLDISRKITSAIRKSKNILLMGLLNNPGKSTTDICVWEGNSRLPITNQLLHTACSGLLKTKLNKITWAGRYEMTRKLYKMCDKSNHVVILLVKTLAFHMFHHDRSAFGETKINNDSVWQYGHE